MDGQKRFYPWRFAVVIAVLAVCFFGLWWLKKYGVSAMPFHCLFHQLTGLHCPGCGMTRATSSILSGDIFAALRCNPLGVILLPIAIIGVGLEAIGWVRGTKPPWNIPLGRYGATAIAVVMILFFILRNLPWFPFTLLAPH